MNLGYNFPGISGTLEPLAGLVSLTTLWLMYNSLSGQLDYLAQLSLLTDLDLVGNTFNGTFDVLRGMYQMSSIQLATNQFSGDISHLSGMSNLTYVDLSDNPALRTNLSVFENKLALYHLSLGNTCVGGHLSSARFLNYLTFLNLSAVSGCSLEASSLTHLRNLTLITDLDLSNNRFYGTLEVRTCFALDILLCGTV